MDVSYRWLRAVAPTIEDSPEAVAERLAMYGAPVDEMVALGAGLEGLVVGRVERSEPHPDADRLSLCDVAVGGETVRVVCGAPNVRDGALYPFAPVGASLPAGTEIRAVEIRGEASRGMLCSERELGLGRDHTGIMELQGSFEPGTPLLEALGLDDVRMVLDVTPNRPDLLSHRGVARELAPGGEADLVLPPFPDAEAAAEQADTLAFETGATSAGTGGVRITIDDPVGCPRYAATLIRDVKVGASPGWLAGRLRAAGLRPINNVVDATNYVLLEMGQPLHAFDVDRLRGPEIIVRRAGPRETLTTLDGEVRRLDESMLVIADADRAVAIAGVMGGEDSEVTEETTDVLLECALFDPKTIRSTRTALGMSTDASFRFERGVDPETTELAARRATELILTVAGGTLETKAVDVYPSPLEPRTVPLRPARVESVLGAAIPAETIVAYLEPLGFQAVSREDELVFRIPGHRRYDVEREVDLIEEVARRHGYDAFPDDMHPFRPSAVPDDPGIPLEERLRDTMVARGFREARRVPFVPEDEGDVELLRPLSMEESRLRRDLVPDLVRAVELNFARGVRHVRLFEVGTVFAPGGEPDGRPAETTRFATVFTGARRPPHWSEEAEPFDAWDLKSILHEVARAAALGSDALEPWRDGAGPVIYAPDVRFRIRDGDGEVVGWGGRVRDDVLDAPAWAGDLWAVELTLRESMYAAPEISYRPLPAFPAIDRDLALLVPNAMAADRVEAVAREAAGPLLEEVIVFDVYAGEGIEEGTRSIAYRLRFRSPERTLTDEEADEAVARVLKRLEEELDVRRRA